AAGMSRQNYYKGRRVRYKAAVAEEAVVSRVQRERRIQPRIGARKLHRMLAEELASAGVVLGRDRWFGVLRRRGLLVRRGRRSARTTDSRHGWRVYGNLAKDLVLGGP